MIGSNSSRDLRTLSCVRNNRRRKRNIHEGGEKKIRVMSEKLSFFGSVKFCEIVSPLGEMNASHGDASFMPKRTCGGSKVCLVPIVTMHYVAGHRHELGLDR